MGYDLSVLRIDFWRFAELRGSKDDRLVRELASRLLRQDEAWREEWEEEQADGENGDEPCVVPSEALRQIVAGAKLGDESDTRPHAIALVEVISHLGLPLGQIHFSSQELGLISDWDKAMAAVGVPESFGSLAHRGALFEFPLIEPFPTIGYMTPEEVSAAARVLRGPRVWPRFWQRRPPIPAMDAGTVQMFRGWLARAGAHGDGLVGVLT